ncbi:MAG: hydrogenase [Verrucomicrobia bacterium]|nr:hydrogenase [Verrucomicrobiota bacterium]
MEIISVLVIVSCLFLLGSSRLGLTVRIVAVQGILLGLLPIIRSSGTIRIGVWVLGLSGILVKGVVLPWLMSVVLRHSGVRREIEPFVGFGRSVLLGVGLLALSVWMAARLKLATEPVPLIMAAMALFLVLVGLFLMISRRKAITQSMAYLVMENGVYAVGISMSLDFPFIVELGILLDVFVGVFLMGNLLFHLDREPRHAEGEGLIELAEHPHPGTVSLGEHG